MRNRTRISSLDAFGLRDQRNRIYPALEAGDGSTLSLDFTAMSSLDSRFTFSRSSPATFINSQGRVQYATHNFLPNTVWTSTSIPTGWTAGVGTGQVTYNGNGSILMGVTTSTQRIFLTPSTAITVANGLKYRIGFLVLTATGTTLLGDIVASNGGTDTYYINGDLAGSGDLVLGGDYIEIIATATGSTMQPRIGVGVNGNPSSFPMSVTVTTPMMNIGSETFGGPINYVANTTTSPYQTPRFDYDPTTLAPRGLLIEGSVVNIFPYSNAMTGGQYEYGVANSLTTTFNNTETASPDGSNNSVKVVKASSSQSYTFVRNQVTPQTSGVHTGSVWVKKPATSGSQYVGLRLTGAGFVPATPDKHLLFDLDTGTVVTGYTANGYYTNPTIVAYPNGWYRISITSGTMSTGSGSAYLSVCMSTPGVDGSEFNTLPAGTCFYMFGPQVEAGSGASSYIPTGSSTVQRAADDCTMQGANFTSWYVSTNPMTLLVDAEIRSNSGFPALMRLGENTGGQGVEYYYVGTTTATIYSKISASTNSELTMDSGVAFGTRQVLGYAIQTGSGLRSRNGATVSASNPVAFPTNTLQRLGIGSSGAAGNYANAHIRRIKYWPVALTQPALNQATTQ